MTIKYSQETNAFHIFDVLKIVCTAKPLSRTNHMDNTSCRYFIRSVRCTPRRMNRKFGIEQCPQRIRSPHMPDRFPSRRRQVDLKKSHPTHGYACEPETEFVDNRSPPRIIMRNSSRTIPEHVNSYATSDRLVNCRRRSSVKNGHWSRRPVRGVTPHDFVRVATDLVHKTRYRRPAHEHRRGELPYVAHFGEFHVRACSRRIRTDFNAT